MKFLGKDDCYVKGSRSSMSLAPNRTADRFVFLREKVAFMDQAFQPPLVNLFMLGGMDVFRQHCLCC